MSIKSVGLALVVCSGTCAVAQTSSVTPPRVYAWSAPDVPSNWPGDQSWGYPLKCITPMVHIDLNSGSPLGSTVGGHPFEAGVIAANRAIYLRGLPGGDPNMPIAILIKEFAKGGDPPTDALDAKRYFFRATTDDLPEPANGWAWPHPMNGNDPDPTANPHLHPFIVNAGGRPDLTTNPPLRQWHVDFLAGYKSVANAPVPSAFLYDNEVFVAESAGRNPIYLLRLLKDTAFWDTMENGNPKYPVPGQDPSKTLKQLCKDASVSFGWGDNLIDRINAGQSAVDTQDNREAMSWWYSVGQGVRDALLKKCAFDVVTSAQYGWTSVKCGNYDDMRLDGGLDTTSWFVDRATSAGGISVDNVDPPSKRAWNHLPRVDADRGWGSPLYFLNNDRRWFGLRKQASGDFDCPVLYELRDSALNGVGNRPGFRQNNIYRGPVLSAPSESDWESAMRVSRHSVESVINSFGGQHVSRLAPWVEMPSTTFDDPAHPTEVHGFRTVQEIGQMMAMLRGKGAPTIQFLYQEGPTPPPATAVANAWTEAAAVVTDVYATKVFSYRKHDGTFGQTQPTPTPDWLEYTLRNSENKDDTVDLLGSCQIGLGDPLWVQDLIVDFIWSPEYIAAILNDTYGFMRGQEHLRPTSLQINVEYTTDRSDAVARVFGLVQKHLDGNNQIVEEQWLEGYGVGTNAWLNTELLDDGRYVNRISVTLGSNSLATMPGLIWPENSGPGGSTVYKTQIKIHQTCPSWSNLGTQYNLVQVYPDFPILANPSGELYSAADLNYDGVVDSRDIEIFIIAWEDEEAPADLNHDGIIDGQDLELFVNG